MYFSTPLDGLMFEKEIFSKEAASAIACLPTVPGWRNQ